MQVNDLLTSYLDYNQWSNNRLSKNLSFVPKDDLHELTLYPFGSVHQTLLHILGAQLIWFQRVLGKRPDSFPSKDQFEDLNQVLRALDESSQKWKNYITNENIFSNKKIEYHNTSGTAFNQSIAGIAMHVVNHGTYHRGQIMSGIRAVYKDKLVPLDFIHYLRETGNEI